MAVYPPSRGITGHGQPGHMLHVFFAITVGKKDHSFKWQDVTQPPNTFLIASNTSVTKPSRLLPTLPPIIIIIMQLMPTLQQMFKLTWTKTKRFKMFKS